MVTIGLEIHCQLTNLNSKLFCSCKANYRGSEPNTNICPVCTGMPGSLPRLNQKAVEKATSIAMALGCKTPQSLAFFRKNYFYPDLPKNFQITQLNIYGQTSIGGEGQISIEDKKIRIRRIQLEEDPGRLIYEGVSEKTRITLVDYNRAGTPLVEIVTEPDFESPKQVRLFLNMLSDLLENLGVSDPTLEGAMRADGNVSIPDGPKVEIKNVTSFYDLEKALHYEITRQETLSSSKIEIEAETRQWDAGRKVTVSARKKEEDLDYRYFLEGDIPWISIGENVRQRLKKDMPESISSKKDRYIESFGIAPQVADVLSSDKYYADLFEQAHDDATAKEIANIITTDLMGLVDTKEKRDQTKITAENLRELAKLILADKITRISAKTILNETAKTGKSPSDIVLEQNLGNVSDSTELSDVIQQVISEEKEAVEQAKTNPQTINYLVGKVMQKTKGRADPKITLELLKEKI